MATNFVDTSDFIGRALLVEGISSVHSQYQTADKLTIHFQKKCNRGGDVTKLIYPLDSNRDAAIVVFGDANDRESTLNHRHVFYDVSLKVHKLPPVFRSIEVEIDPFYDTHLPDVVHSLMRSRQILRNPSFGRQNTHKLSFTHLSELRSVEEEVYTNIGKQSETAHFSSAATGHSYPVQFMQAGLTQQEGMNYEDEAVMGKEEETEPEFFIDQQTTKRDDSADHVANDKKIEEDKATTTDVQMRDLSEQSSDYGGDGSSTKTDHTVILEMFSFKFFMKFEKAAFEKILKKHNVRCVQKEVDFSVQVTFLPCKTKKSAKEIQNAVDDFSALYQTNQHKLSRKTVDCPPSVSDDKLEEAASKTYEFFQNSVNITRIPGNPVRYVFLSCVDVEKVVQYFRKIADIKSSKKLKNTSLVPKDTQGASAQSAGSQFGNTNQSDQVERDSHLHTSTSYSSSPDATSSPTQPPGVLGDVHFVTNEGIHICIRKGDITMQQLEAVVSPCERNLSNSGGAAMAIGKAAGFQLEKWCLDYMRQRNFHHIDVMQCLISPGFNLCRTIIHAIGPNSSDKQDFLNKLYHTFLNCLHSADYHKITSLAMPLIGSGMIAGPKKDCADALVQAIFDFSRQGNKSKHLRDIYLVNIDSKASEAIKLSFEVMFKSPITNRSDPAAAKAGNNGPDAAQGMSKEGDKPSDKDIQNELKEIAAALSKHDPNQIKSDKASDTKTSTMSSKTSSTDDKTANDECPICLMDLKKDTPVQVLSCKHRFCKACIKEHLKSNYMCPVCRAVCGQLKGDGPDGTMSVHTYQYNHLPGFERVGTITITYNLPSGIQSVGHPNPGKPYNGATRTAYLPNNKEGQEVLSLLRKAFDARLVFTVGSSVTTGAENTVTWTSIHHKTSQMGGPSNYGYPDSGYLQRVKEDLAALGIK